MSAGHLTDHPDVGVLRRGERVTLRTVGAFDHAAVAGIYRENARFFQTLAGVDAPTAEHVLSDMTEAPPGYETNKYFLGVCARDGALMGVADFVVHYPVAGRGCFGLLLLSERWQGEGLGAEAAALVEAWARDAYGVRDVTLGVELVNERARRFWRRCGYAPTGEVFESAALGRANPAELLVKRIG